MKLKLCFLTIVGLWSLTTLAQDKRLATIAQEYGLPGMQVVHFKKGKQHSLVYGKKNTDSTALITEHTVFQAASLTKVITAYTFFSLYDQGLIELDQPLASYFTYSRLANNVAGKLVTARMVLTHRTGFLNWEGPVGSAAWYQTLLNNQFVPGAHYKYSGEGFYYLQLVMEKVTGKSFRELVQKEVLDPLGMKNSDMQWNDEKFKDFSYGHYDAKKVRRLAKWSYTNAAYTLYTTAIDYTKFVQQALVLGKGLKPKTYQLMVNKANEAQKEVGVLSEDDKHVPVALGMRIQYNEAGTWLWHTGSNPGFRCFFIVNPKTKESLVGFSNADTGMPAFNALMEAFLTKGQTFWAYKWRNGELD
ncbi:serine hydrolase domain-containing protein [Pedobacter sp.]